MLGERRISQLWRSFWLWLSVWVFAAAWTGTAFPESRGADGSESDGHLVSFPGPGGSALKGYLYIPDGAGPFPAMLWNHGSEPHPSAQPVLARFYMSHGYVFFVPHRAGQGQSPGPYIMDEIHSSHGAAFAVAQEHANLDVAAALRWLSQRPEVDPKKIALSGCSFGGIQTILAAGHSFSARAFVAFAPGAMSWSNGQTQELLASALRKARAPVLIIQAHNDYSLGPSLALGKVAEARGGRATVYPDFGASHQDGHWRFATTQAGIDIWGSDVLAFVAAALGDEPQ